MSNYTIGMGMYQSVFCYILVAHDICGITLEIFRSVALNTSLENVGVSKCWKSVDCVARMWENAILRLKTGPKPKIGGKMSWVCCVSPLQQYYSLYKLPVATLMNVILVAINAATQSRTKTGHQFWYFLRMGSPGEKSGGSIGAVRDSRGALLTAAAILCVSAVLLSAPP